MKKKIIYIFLANLIIYTLSIIHVKIYPKLTNHFFKITYDKYWPQKLVFLGVVSAVIFVLIISVPIVCINKKVDLNYKDAVILIAVNYLLFFVYHEQGYYFFINTAAEGDFVTKDRPAMSPPIAAFWITLQYAVVMLITIAVLRNREKADQ